MGLKNVRNAKVEEQYSPNVDSAAIAVPVEPTPTARLAMQSLSSLSFRTSSGTLNPRSHFQQSPQQSPVDHLPSSTLPTPISPSVVSTSSPTSPSVGTTPTNAVGHEPEQSEAVSPLPTPIQTSSPLPNPSQEPTLQPSPTLQKDQPDHQPSSPSHNITPGNPPPRQRRRAAASKPESHARTTPISASKSPKPPPPPTPAVTTRHALPQSTPNVPAMQFIPGTNILALSPPVAYPEPAPQPPPPSPPTTISSGPSKPKPMLTLPPNPAGPSSTVSLSPNPSIPPQLRADLSEPTSPANSSDSRSSKRTPASKRRRIDDGTTPSPTITQASNRDITIPAPQEAAKQSARKSPSKTPTDKSHALSPSHNTTTAAGQSYHQHMVYPQQFMVSLSPPQSTRSVASDPRLETSSLTIHTLNQRLAYISQCYDDLTRKHVELGKRYEELASQKDEAVRRNGEEEREAKEKEKEKERAMADDAEKRFEEIARKNEELVKKVKEVEVSRDLVQRNLSAIKVAYKREREGNERERRRVEEVVRELVESVREVWGDPEDDAEEEREAERSEIADEDQERLGDDGEKHAGSTAIQPTSVPQPPALHPKSPHQPSSQKPSNPTPTPTLSALLVSLETVVHDVLEDNRSLREESLALKDETQILKDEAEAARTQDGEIQREWEEMVGRVRVLEEEKEQGVRREEELKERLREAEVKLSAESGKYEKDLEEKDKGSRSREEELITRLREAEEKFSSSNEEHERALSDAEEKHKLLVAKHEDVVGKLDALKNVVKEEKATQVTPEPSSASSPSITDSDVAAIADLTQKLDELKDRYNAVVGEWIQARAARAKEMEKSEMTERMRVSALKELAQERTAREEDSREFESEKVQWEAERRKWLEEKGSFEVEVGKWEEAMVVLREKQADFEATKESFTAEKASWTQERAKLFEEIRTLSTERQRLAEEFIQAKKLATEAEAAQTALQAELQQVKSKKAKISEECPRCRSLPGGQTDSPSKPNGMPAVYPTTSSLPMLCDPSHATSLPGLLISEISSWSRMSSLLHECVDLVSLFDLPSLRSSSHHDDAYDFSALPFSITPSDHALDLFKEEITNLQNTMSKLCSSREVFLFSLTGKLAPMFQASLDMGIFSAKPTSETGVNSSFLSALSSAREGLSSLINEPPIIDIPITPSDPSPGRSAATSKRNPQSSHSPKKSMPTVEVVVEIGQPSPPRRPSVSTRTQSPLPQDKPTSGDRPRSVRFNEFPSIADGTITRVPVDTEAHSESTQSVLIGPPRHAKRKRTEQDSGTEPGFNSAAVGGDDKSPKIRRRRRRISFGF